MSAKDTHYLIPLAVCLYILFALSSQPYPEQSLIPWLSRHVSQEKLAAILPDISVRYGSHFVQAKRDPYDFVEFFCRKGAHVLSYSLLGSAIFYAMHLLRSAAQNTPVRLAGMVLGLSAAAFLDEWNQTRALMRTGQMIDVWLDLIGGTLGAFLLIPLFRKMREMVRRWPALKMNSSP